jgi:hypothetical protein
LQIVEEIQREAEFDEREACRLGMSRQEYEEFMGDLAQDPETFWN